MQGGADNDTYVIDSLLDVVDESVIGSSGWDTVRSSTVSVDLSNAARFKGSVEAVQLTGLSNINAVGNNLGNVIYGNAGNNVINGAFGNDTLRGNGGSDTFVFNTTLGAGNVDTIDDFAVDDTINLENAIFLGLTQGAVLTAAEFVIGAAATNANQHIIYNSATGGLFYDQDGNGAGAAIHFATVSAGLALTNNDFFVV